jgi:hypothetical protein
MAASFTERDEQVCARHLLDQDDNLWVADAE